MPSLQFYLYRPLMRAARWWQARLPVEDGDALVRFRKRADRTANLVMRVPRGVTVERAALAGVPGDWLIPDGAPADPVLLFLHGGGTVFGWGSPHRRLVGHLARFAGLRTLGADYRLAPEHAYPAAHDDCYAVYEALVRQGRQVVLVGESSGGVLALAALLRAREAGLPQPQLCAFISPNVDYCFQDPRIWQSRDVFVDPKFIVALTGHYVAGTDTMQPDLSPIYADLSGIAPLYVLVGEREVLRGEAERLVDAARLHGVAVDLVVWPHVWHGWHVLVSQLPEATSALRALGDAIRQRVLAC